MNLKLNRWLKRYSDPCMWVAGGCTGLGIYMHHISSVPQAAVFFFVAGTVLAGFPILFRAGSGLRYKTVGIEVLVTIAVVGAFCIGEYSEAAIVTFLFQFGTWLEQKTMKKTRSAIKELTEMAPATAWRIDGSETEEIEVDEVEEGDLLLVKTGGKVPVDGIVIEGEGHVNEAGITGESIPKHKIAGDSVYAGTILDSGLFKIRAVKVGEDTTFAKIIALVEEAQDAKSPAERFIDRFARYYTPAVVVLAAAVFLILRDLDTAITVLVLACPGALVIGAPIANVAGIGRGARAGILLKGGDSVHTFARTDTFVFDKTGTLTEGYPQVTAVYGRENDSNERIRLTACAEQQSDHPLAQAIVRYAKEQGLELTEPSRTETQKGRGIVSRVEEHELLVGNQRLLSEYQIEIPEHLRIQMENSQKTGGSFVLTAVDGQAELLFVIRDEVKPDAKKSLDRLKKMGIRRLVMLTGDHPAAATAAARSLGLDEIYAELLPQDKLEKIRQLQQKGCVVTFVGDGINDSPALTAADTGIAMGSGTDVAIDSSDVVLIHSTLDSAVTALSLSRKTVSILYQNIWIAVGTVLFLLAGLFAGYIHMSIGMLVHEASIMVVILNAMRLLIWRL